MVRTYRLDGWRRRVIGRACSLAGALVALLHGDTAAWGATTNVVEFGNANDFFVPEDYDGDGRTDPAVWRSGSEGAARFMYLSSAAGVIVTNIIGQTGDDPTVVADYDGDGRADPALYRPGALAGQTSTWYFILSSGDGQVSSIRWGLNGDFPCPGDYDGDGSANLTVQRNAGGGSAAFHIRTPSGGTNIVIHGTPTDRVVPGDYDGDHRTDLATIRSSGGQYIWSIWLIGSGLIRSNVFGNSATDFPIQGDYNGDGFTDLAVWRPSVGGGTNYVHFSPFVGTNTDLVIPLGQNGDYPPANFNSH